MCGVVGFLSYKRDNYFSIDNVISLLKSIAHRGPDNTGLYIKAPDGSSKFDRNIHQDNLYYNDLKNDLDFDEVAMFIGHTRFSIIDLKPSSNQPFVDDSNQLIMSFNGEIFNYLELKEELSDSYNFVTNSDTEIVYYAYKKWGTDCFRRFNGFWSIVFYDKLKNQLVLCRDRYGEKPLYYINSNNGFIFSSEQRSLDNYHDKDVDFNSLYYFLELDRRDCFTHSFFTSIRSVPKSSYMTIDLTSYDITTKQYYFLPQISDLPLDINKLLNKLKDSIKYRLLSDVPVAISLSGGLDSAVIATMMRELFPNREFTAYTIKYKEDVDFDETRKAKLIAKSLNFKLKIIEITEHECWEYLDEGLSVGEEPTHSFATISQLIAWKRIADDGIRVLLNGSAADELLLGYEYYSELNDVQKLRNLQLPKYIRGLPFYHFKSIARVAKWFLNGKLFSGTSYAEKKRKLPFIDFFMNNEIINNENYLIHSNLDPSIRRYSDFDKLRIEYWNVLMDKNMMAVPIEVRSPFLDVNLVDYVLGCSTKELFNNGYTKNPLRIYLNGKLPDDIVWEKNKIGFNAPMSMWMRRFEENNFKLCEQQLGHLFNKPMSLFWHNLPAKYKWRLLIVSKWLKKHELSVTL